MQTAEEKIQKAREIYYRRNKIKYRGEDKKKKKHSGFIILVIMIIFGVYIYQNRTSLITQERQKQIREILNTPIEFKKIFNINPNTKTENKINEEENKVEENQEEPKAEEVEESAIIWPAKGTITSGFGIRDSNDEKVSTNHTGIDIAGNEGDKIISAISGKVAYVSEEGNLGKHIKIENQEYGTVYAHCNEIFVEDGVEVKQGDVIATIGNTGNSTGNHLHFEVIANGEYIDPQTVLP